MYPICLKNRKISYNVSVQFQSEEEQKFDEVTVRERNMSTGRNSMRFKQRKLTEF
jgi:hypothetical protein